MVFGALIRVSPFCQNLKLKRGAGRLRYNFKQEPPMRAWRKRFGRFQYLNVSLL
jgi:hypothetical protein